MAAYKIRNGQGPWVYYSSRALAEKFPYMNDRSISRWIIELEESKELVSCVDNNIKYDKTKSFTIPQFLHHVRQNEESSSQNEATIPPLSSPLPLTEGARPKTAHALPKKKRPFGYDESVSSDSYEDAIDLDSGNVVDRFPTKSEKNASSQMLDLIRWASGRRGKAFVSVPKQLKALGLMRRANRGPQAIMARWVDLENDDFYAEKGFDFMTVAMSFDKK